MKRSGEKRNEEKGREGKEREEIRGILEDRERCGCYRERSDGYLEQEEHLSFHDLCI